MQNIKMWDHDNRSWVPIESVGWKFRDMFPEPIYKNIELVRGTGVKANIKKKILKSGKLVDSFVLTEVYESDYLMSPEGVSYEVIFSEGAFILKEMNLPFMTLSPLKLITSEEGWEIFGNNFEGRFGEIQTETPETAREIASKHGLRPLSEENQRDATSRQRASVDAGETPIYEI